MSKSTNVGQVMRRIAALHAQLAKAVRLQKRAELKQQIADLTKKMWG